VLVAGTQDGFGLRQFLKDMAATGQIGFALGGEVHAARGPIKGMMPASSS